MQTDKIKGVLELKEKEVLNIFNTGFKKRDVYTPNEYITEKDIVFFLNFVDDDFKQVSSRYLEKLGTLTFDILSKYKEEILEDIKNSDEALVNVLSVNIVAQEQGNTINLQVPYINEHNKDADSLINEINDIQLQLDAILQKVLGEYTLSTLV